MDTAPADLRPISLFEWLKTAKPGDRYRYAVGNLAQLRWDCTQTTRALRRIPTPEQQRMLDDAQDAWLLYRRGLVYLVQRRLKPPKENGVGVFAYFAVRTAQPS